MTLPYREHLEESTMNIAIVTGASSGMGREFVLQLPAVFSKHTMSELIM